MINTVVNFMESLCQISVNVVAEQSASSILLLLYLLSYKLCNKSYFLVAFIFIEYIGFSPYFDFMSEEAYNLSKAFIYSLLFWVIHIRFNILKLMAPCVIMILFQSIMALDAFIFGDVKTALYNNHTAIVVLIHLFIISALHDWQRLGRVLGANIRAINAFLGLGDASSFFCYSVINIFKQKA